MAPILGWSRSVGVSSLQSRGLATTVGPTACAEIIFPLISTGMVVFRLWLRKRFDIKLGWDDYSIAIAQPLFWLFWAVWFYSSNFIVKTTISKLDGSGASKFLKMNFVLLTPYILTIVCVKLSALFLYLRAFGFGTGNATKYTIYAMFAVNVALALTRLAGSFSFCDPVSDFWNHPTRCSSLFNDWALSIESISLATEIALLVFPVPIIWRMRAANARAKLTIYAAFALGGLLVLSHGARIAMLKITQYTISEGLSDTILPALVLLSFVELCLGTCSVSLPAMYSSLRLLLKRSRRFPQDSLEVNQVTEYQDGSSPEIDDVTKNTRTVVTVSTYSAVDTRLPQKSLTTVLI